MFVLFHLFIRTEVVLVNNQTNSSISELVPYCVHKSENCVHQSENCVHQYENCLKLLYELFVYSIQL